LVICSLSDALRSARPLLVGVAPLALTAAFIWTGPIPAARAQPDTVISSYTEEQADRGEDAYQDNCALCHGLTLGGEGETPGLIGSGFRDRRLTGSPAPFFDFISTEMPQQAPGSLEAEIYADIAAYLMQRNRIPAGDTPLPSDPEALAGITLPPVAN
jgi:mono/diheme cytochrome c family protein